MEVIVECASDGAFYKGISAVSSIDLDAGDFATCGLDEQSLPMNRLPGLARPDAFELARFLA